MRSSVFWKECACPTVGRDKLLCKSLFAKKKTLLLTPVEEIRTCPFVFATSFIYFL